MELKMNRWKICYAIVIGMSCVGCGGGDTIQLPTDAFTEEQKAQIKKDDAKVADEESHGAKRR